MVRAHAESTGRSRLTRVPSKTAVISTSPPWARMNATRVETRTSRWRSMREMFSCFVRVAPTRVIGRGGVFYTQEPMDRPANDPATTAPPELERMRLRYPGTCVACGLALAKGAEALYDRQARTIRCVECPTGPESHGNADAEEPQIDAGTAGASARREYERRRDSRESRIKDRFGGRVGGLILAITDEPQSTRAWAQGAAGEHELAEALSGVDGVRVLHDRRVPGTAGNIDHIVVAPAGVFVVDAKRYQGLIRIRDVGGFFKRDDRLYVGNRDRSKLAEAMGWQVEAVERALRAVPVDPMPPIIPVLCFVDGEWPWFRPPDTYAGVRLEGARSIQKLVAASQVLDAPAIDRLTRVLASAFPPE